MIWQHPEGGGVLLRILGGMIYADRFSKSWPYFRPKLSFSTPVFKTWPLRNYVIISDYKTNKKVSQNPFWICIRSYTPVVHSKTIPESRPIRAKVYTRFQTKTAQKPYPLGRHILPPGVAWSMDVYRQPRALYSKGKIEIFSYVSLICIYKPLVIGINAFFECLYL